METIHGSATSGERLALLYRPSQTLNSFAVTRSMVPRMTSEGRMTGTPFYVAPELAPGDDFDGGDDLYLDSLRTVFYQLTNRRLPFIADDLFTCPPMPLFQATRSPNLLRGLITHASKVQWGRRYDG